MVDLLQELTDIDTLHESEEGAEVLIDALVSMSGGNYIIGITGLRDGVSVCIATFLIAIIDRWLRTKILRSLIVIFEITILCQSPAFVIYKMKIIFNINFMFVNQFYSIFSDSFFDYVFAICCIMI